MTLPYFIVTQHVQLDGLPHDTMEPGLFAPARLLTEGEKLRIRELIQTEVEAGLPGNCWFYIAKTLKLPHDCVKRYGDGIDGVDITPEAVVQISPGVFAPDRPLTGSEITRVRELSQRDIQDGLPGTCWFHIANILELPHASVTRYGEDTDGRLLATNGAFGSGKFAGSSESVDSGTSMEPTTPVVGSNEPITHPPDTDTKMDDMKPQGICDAFNVNLIQVNVTRYTPSIWGW